MVKVFEMGGGDSFQCERCLTAYYSEETAVRCESGARCLDGSEGRKK